LEKKQQENGSSDLEATKANFVLKIATNIKVSNIRLLRLT